MTTTTIWFLTVIGLAGSAAHADPEKRGVKRIEISVTAKGFAPDNVQVTAAQPVMLVFTRTTDRTCAKRVVIQLGDGKKVEQDLPLDKAVEVAVTFAKKGELRYSCAMDMISGVITIQ